MEHELIGERTRTALAYQRLPNEAWRTLARLNGAGDSPTPGLVRGHSRRFLDVRLTRPSGRVG